MRALILAILALALITGMGAISVVTYVMSVPAAAHCSVGNCWMRALMVAQPRSAAAS